MSRAVDAHLGRLADDDAGNQARLQLWPEAALQMLYFTVMHDPSVRMRRAAMALLSSVAVGAGAPSVVKLAGVVLGGVDVVRAGWKLLS